MVVKVEDGVGGAVADEGPQPEADAGRPWQRRRLSEAGAAVSDEALSRRAYLEAQALAVEGMERTRVLGEELLQAKALIAKLEAEARIKDVIIQSKDGIIQSKDEQLKADIRFKDELLQAKDVIIQSKDDQLQHAKDAQLAALAAAHHVGIGGFGAVVPVPRVVKRLYLGGRIAACGAFEQDVVAGVGIERRV